MYRQTNLQLSLMSFSRKTQQPYQQQTEMLVTAVVVRYRRHESVMDSTFAHLGYIPVENRTENG